MGLVAAGALTVTIRALLVAGHSELPGMLPLGLPERDAGPCDTAVQVTGSLQRCATLLSISGPACWSTPSSVTIPVEEWIDPTVPAPEHRALLVLALPKAGHPLHIQLALTHLRRVGASREFATCDPGPGPLVEQLDLR